MIGKFARHLVRLAAMAIGFLPWAVASAPIDPAPLPNGVPKPELTGFVVPEIVGGQPSDERLIVGIVLTRSGKQFVCSGLLISNARILTAAHCTCGAESYMVTNSTYGQGPWFPAQFISRFNYDCWRGPIRGNDLALLRLDFPMHVNDSEHGICPDFTLLDRIELGAALVAAPPRTIVVGGYGYEGDTPDSMGTRRTVDVDLNSVVCSGPMSRRMGCAPLAEFIAGVRDADDPHHRDTCAGDSGGPAFLRRADQSLVPLGIVSRGLPIKQPFPARGDCGRGGIYTHLGRHDVLEWLRENGVQAELGSKCKNGDGGP